jgi:hypothetical protein
MCLVFGTVYLLLHGMTTWFVVSFLANPMLIQWIDHHIYLCLFGQWASVYLSKLAHEAFANFYRRVFDSRYLVRRQLQNFS